MYLTVLYYTYYIFLASKIIAVDVKNGILQKKTTEPLRSLEGSECGRSIFGKASCFQPMMSQVRVYGGKRAKLGEIPWQAKLIYNKSYIGGGALISKGFVLTSGHVVRSPSGIHSANLTEVHLGVHDKLNITQHFQILNVEKIIIHPNFEKTQMQNDIALVKLMKCVEYNLAVQPVCLPWNLSNMLVNTAAVGSGWGIEEPYVGKADVAFKTVALQILNNSHPFCENGAFSYNNREMYLCAFSANGSVAQGDSGGPLVTWLDGKCTLAGLLSFGWAGQPDYAMVFTRVSTYVEWINITARFENDAYCDIAW